jgi:N-acyl-D-aspartate/D-glutamate deacylase
MEGEPAVLLGNCCQYFAPVSEQDADFLKILIRQVTQD